MSDQRDDKSHKSLIDKLFDLAGRMPRPYDEDRRYSQREQEQLLADIKTVEHAAEELARTAEPSRTWPGYDPNTPSPLDKDAKREAASAVPSLPAEPTIEMLDAMTYGVIECIGDRAPADDMRTLRERQREAWQRIVAASTKTYGSAASHVPSRTDR